MYIGPHLKYQLFLSYFNENCTFNTNFSNIAQIRNFMKIRSVKTELFHAVERTDGQANGQTDRQKNGKTEGQTDGNT